MSFLIQADTPAWHCWQGNRKRKVSGLRLVFLFSSEDPGSWDPAAVEPSICPSEDHDLSEPETLEAEAAFVSILHMRAMREFCVKQLTFCSIAANEPILAQKALTICSTLVTDGPDLIFKIGKSRTSGPNISRNSLNCASYERWHTPSRSALAPLGEPKFEEVAGKTDTGTVDASSTHAMKAGGKQQNWVVDTRSRQNRDVGKPYARLNRKWLDPKMATERLCALCHNCLVALHALSVSSTEILQGLRIPWK